MVRRWLTRRLQLQFGESLDLALFKRHAARLGAYAGHGSAERDWTL